MKITEDQDKLVALAIDGDNEAFTQLFRSYQNPIYNFIYRMLGNEDEAADATQEVFFKVYKKISTLRNPEYFSTWLFSIAKNEAVSLARCKKRKNHSSIDSISDENTKKQIQDYSILDPDKKLLNDEFEVIFQKILSELPEIYRMAFILGVLEGHAYEDVARIMNCSVGNVKSRVFRARAQIAQKLHKVYTFKMT